MEDGGEMWEGAPDEEDRGKWDSFCAPADVCRVLTQGWSPSHVETFGPSSSRTSMPLWQQQVLPAIRFCSFPHQVTIDVRSVGLDTTLALQLLWCT